jgi:exonuclease SbcD
MITVVHTADHHWEVEKIEKCIKAADFIVEQLQIIKPDVHVIAGDVWHRRQTVTDSSAMIPALNAVKQMANVCPTIIIKGNNSHDSEGSLEIFRDLKTDYPLYITERAGTIGFFRLAGGITAFIPYEDFKNYSEQPDAIFHLMSYPEKSHLLSEMNTTSIEESNMVINYELRRLFIGMGAMSHDYRCPTIFVGHCNILGSKLSTGQTLIGQDIIINPKDFELTGSDVVCLGHIHEWQRFDGNVWYSGSIYNGNFGETSPRHLLIHRVEKGSCVTEEIEIPSTPMAMHECECEYDGDLLHLKDKNETVCDWIGAELRVRVYLTKDQRGLVTEDQIKQKYHDAQSYQIEYITIAEQRIRSHEIIKAQSLRSKLVEWGSVISKELDAQTLDYADKVETSIAAE